MTDVKDKVILKQAERIVCLEETIDEMRDEICSLKISVEGDERTSSLLFDFFGVIASRLPAHAIEKGWVPKP